MPITLDGTLGVTTPMYNGSIAANAVTPSVNMKNRIINGAMVIDQRNAGASVNSSNSNTYVLDRWITYSSVNSTFSTQQNAGSITPPAGFTKYMGFTSLAATTQGASSYYYFGQPIEGSNVADFGWGTADAKTVTLSFWVRCFVAGTYSGVLTNSAANRTYPFTFVVNSSNTWEQKSVTIAGDTSGTWLTNNGIGIYLYFNLGCGSSNLATANVWGSSSAIGATGSIALVNTNGATFYITGVQLEVGSTATSFDYRPYGTELGLCQRYYFRVGAPNTGYHGFGAGVAQNTTTVVTNVKLPVTMRTVPTGSYGGTINLLSNALTSPSSLGVTATAGTYVDGLRVDFATSGQTTAGGICAYTNNTASDFIQFSAEL